MVGKGPLVKHDCNDDIMNRSARDRVEEDDVVGDWAKEGHLARGTPPSLRLMDSRPWAMTKSRLS